MTEHADGPGSQIDHDAMHAWSFALNLDGASPERYAATLKTVLELFDFDASRIERAAAGCRARRDSDADDIWGAAVDLLEQGLAQMRGREQRRMRPAAHGSLNSSTRNYTRSRSHTPGRIATTGAGTGRDDWSSTPACGGSTRDHAVPRPVRSYCCCALAARPSANSTTRSASSAAAGMYAGSTSTTDTAASAWAHGQSVPCDAGIAGCNGEPLRTI